MSISICICINGIQSCETKAPFEIIALHYNNTVYGLQAFHDNNNDNNICNVLPGRRWCASPNPEFLWEVATFEFLIWFHIIHICISMEL